jgi:hypothetical protein
VRSRPPGQEARPASAAPHAPADWSRLPARPAPRGHLPSAEPRPADDLRPLEAPLAARPNHSRTPEVVRTAAHVPAARQFVQPQRHARGASCDLASPAWRPAPRPPRPTPPPIGHDSPPAPPRAVTSRRPNPGQPTICDHSTPNTRHVLTTHGPPRSHQLPLTGLPRDSPCDLGETDTARRATSPLGREARPASAPPHTPADRSRLPAHPTPPGHVPSAEPRPADTSRPLEAPHAARPDHSRTAEVARTAARGPAGRQFVRPRRSARGASCDRGDPAHPHQTRKES